MKHLTPARRRFIYRVANAAIAVVVVYGLVNGEEAAAWLLLINATLGLADANVPDGGINLRDLD